jgi:hypothetical protein
VGFLCPLTALSAPSFFEVTVNNCAVTAGSVCLIDTNLIFLDQLTEVVINGEHSVFRSDLDESVDLLEFPLTDTVTEGMVHDHDFFYEHACVRSFRFDESLRNDGSETVRKLGDDLALLVRREYINETIQ